MVLHNSLNDDNCVCKLSGHNLQQWLKLGEKVKLHVDLSFLVFYTQVIKLP